MRRRRTPYSSSSIALHSAWVAWSSIPHAVQPARPCNRPNPDPTVAPYPRPTGTSVSSPQTPHMARLEQPITGRPSVAAALCCLRWPLPACLASFGAPGRPRRLSATCRPRWPIRAVACTAGQHVPAPIISAFPRVWCDRSACIPAPVAGAFPFRGAGLFCSLPSPLVHSPRAHPFPLSRLAGAGPLAGCIMAVAARPPLHAFSIGTSRWLAHGAWLCSVTSVSAVLWPVQRYGRNEYVSPRTVWTNLFSSSTTCQRRNDTECIVRSPA
jgi:hypothetical protein